MTAHALKGDQERCLHAGMDSYISKPVKGEELIELVERMAEQPAGLHAAPAPQPVEATSPGHAAPPAARTSVFDLDDAVTHCFGNYRLFQDMVGCLFGEGDALLEQMRTALANGNATEMGNVAHRLKGTVCYLGAAPALEANRRVEEMDKAGNLEGAAEAIHQLTEQVEILKAALAPHRRGDSE
jgi:two-component system, sensor histidine kinase and response regulator